METNWHVWSTKQGLPKRKNTLNSVQPRKHVLYRWEETNSDKERDGKGKTEKGGVNAWCEHAFTNIRISRRRILILEYQKSFKCTEYSNIRCSPNIYTRTGALLLSLFFFSFEFLDNFVWKSTRLSENSLGNWIYPDYRSQH